MSRLQREIVAGILIVLAVFCSTQPVRANDIIQPEMLSQEVQQEHIDKLLTMPMAECSKYRLADAAREFTHQVNYKVFNTTERDGKGSVTVIHLEFLFASTYKITVQFVPYMDGFLVDNATFNGMPVTEQDIIQAQEGICHVLEYNYGETEAKEIKHDKV